MPLGIPPYSRLHGPTITPLSWESIGPFITPYFVTAVMGSAAWPLSNLSILVPFSSWGVPTIREVAWMNGTGTLGNIDIGIYASDGATLLASLGSTAKSTASVVITSTTFTDFALPQGDYYMACAVDDGTKTLFAHAMPAGLLSAAGVLEAASNFPLATGITPIATTRAYLPLFALCMEATAL